MDTAHIRLGTLLVLLLAASLGCKKSPLPSTGAAPASPSPDTIARVHWLGRHQMAYKAGAATMMRLWGSTQAATLQRQTLDKLASAPWRWLLGDNQATNPQSLLLRPLLDDVVRDECNLELRHPPNQGEELVFAIRLDAGRAGLWETNLAGVLQSLTGARPVASGGRSWTLRREQPPGLVEITREGEWTLVGAAMKENPLLREVIGLIRRDPAPFGVLPAATWLEAEADLKRLAADLCRSPDSNLPRVFLSVSGDGAHVLQHGRLVFPEALRVQLEPWTVPDNLNSEPLNSFTSVRGFKLWLASFKPWTDLQIGSPPNQLCLWSPQSSPLQTYLCAPSNDGDVPAGSVVSSPVARLTDRLVREGNPRLASHGVGTFMRLPDSDGAVWAGLPLISPYIKSVAGGASRLVIGAMLFNPESQASPTSPFYYHPDSRELLQELGAEPNLVYFDWELTAPRTESTLRIGQALRVGLGCRQVPLESASLAWLNTIRYRLGNSTTRIALSGPSELSFDRTSTIGLTGAELNLLADWLESPRFPAGLYSSSAPPR